MRRVELLEILRSHRDDLNKRGVAMLSVFGSVVRDEATDASDVDLLVEFDRPVGLFAFAALQEYLEQILGCPVDLVTPDALKEPLRERILKEAVRAA